MPDTTTIEWVIAVARSRGMDARVWNPVRGCRPASDGCMNCWAARVADTRSKHPNPAIRARHEGLTTRNADGKPVFNGTVRLIEDDLTIPLRTKRPSVWFAPSEGDLFAEGITDEMRDRVFAVMSLCHAEERGHIFQVLTKRARVAREYIAKLTIERIKDAAGQINWFYDCPGDAGSFLSAWPVSLPLPNVWLGVSVENQAAADERIPHLLATPASVRFLSCEPLLGPVDMKRWLPTGRKAVSPNGIPFIAPHFYLMKCEHCGWVGSTELCPPGDEDVVCPSCFRSSLAEELDGIGWVIAGGESGSKARPMHPDWARSLRDQCAATGVPFLHKQNGEWGSGYTNITSGKSVFRQFANFQQWVNKASTWVNGGICLDKNGKQMKTGADMQEAEKDGGFPITIMHRVGKKSAGRLLDGVEHNAVPEVHHG